MDQDDCSYVTDQDRDSQDRRVRWRYWRCRGGRGGRWGGDSSNPQPTTTTLYITQPTKTASVPSPDSTSYAGQTSPFAGYSQTDIGDQAEGTKTSSAALIAGIASGIVVLIILGLVLWWFLRRRRSRGSLSPTKEGARSMEQQQQPTYSETQQIHPGQRQGLGQEQIRDIPFPPPAVARHAVNKSISSISSASLPIQLPKFPSPTPRDRRLSAQHRPNASASSVPYLESNPIPPQPSLADNFSGYASQPTEVAVPPNDFYIDMLGLGTEKVLVNSNITSPYPSAMARPHPPPQHHTSTATSSSSTHPNSGPIFPPVSTRSRSSSIASLKKHSESARVAGASPKLSRDARQKVQQFPPPPPPPQVPPPAIPDEVLGQSPYSRTPRSRSVTTSLEGKEPLSQYWVPSPSNSRPSSYLSNSGRKNGSPARGKQCSSRSASLSRKATDPAQGPSPEPCPLPSHSPQPHERGARDKRSLRSHRRSQSNIYGGGSTASMDALDRSLNMSPAQLRAPSSPSMPLPILRRNNSYGGHSSDSSQDVEGIISGALAITAAKKQSGGTSLSVPVYQDKHLYI
ncbi:MAG: hypothetical protein JOS17DRAFT_751416 [Linnemannia elongata]|nr:MAG: hypothetical protein JOS17DRAFT_751416 [Linnemannia elongata]